jgi:hypothetical protein
VTWFIKMALAVVEEKDWKGRNRRPIRRLESRI